MEANVEIKAETDVDANMEHNRPARPARPAVLTNFATTQQIPFTLSRTPGIQPIPFHRALCGQPSRAIRLRELLNVKLDSNAIKNSGEMLMIDMVERNPYTQNIRLWGKTLQNTRRECRWQDKDDVPIFLYNVAFNAVNIHSETIGATSPTGNFWITIWQKHYLLTEIPLQYIQMFRALLNAAAAVDEFAGNKLVPTIMLAGFWNENTFPEILEVDHIFS